jgi:hypothetical protein
VRVLHLRERELSGYRWYARESKDEASFAVAARRTADRQPAVPSSSVPELS